jgi:hypothetical protein
MEKSDLKGYRALVIEVGQLKEQMQVLESSLYSPKGQRFTSMPKSPTGYRSTMDGAVDRHIQLCNKYATELADKEARQLAIETAISSLKDPDERVVMRERYIKAQEWPVIVRKLQKEGYSERTIYRLHGMALLKLKEAKYD